MTPDAGNATAMLIRFIAQRPQELLSANGCWPLCDPRCLAPSSPTTLTFYNSPVSHTALATICSRGWWERSGWSCHCLLLFPDTIPPECLALSYVKLSASSPAVCEWERPDKMQTGRRSHTSCFYQEGTKPQIYSNCCRMGLRGWFTLFYEAVRRPTSRQLRPPSAHRPG